MYNWKDQGIKYERSSGRDQGGLIVCLSNGCRNSQLWAARESSRLGTFCQDLSYHNNLRCHHSLVLLRPKTYRCICTFYSPLDEMNTILINCQQIGRGDKIIREDRVNTYVRIKNTERNKSFKESRQKLSYLKSYWKLCPKALKKWYFCLKWSLIWSKILQKSLRLIFRFEIFFSLL